MKEITKILRAVRTLAPAHHLQREEAYQVAERQASKLLELLESAKPPIDLVRFGELDGVTIEFVPDLIINGTPSSGGSKIRRSQVEIKLNANDARTRRRFTMAHELKHIIDDSAIDYLYRGPHDGDDVADQRAEELCDYFAGCLLMPRQWLKALWGNGNQDQRKLAALFNVSPAAMNVRLTVIGLVDGRWRHHQSQGNAWSRPLRTYLRRSDKPEPCPVAS